ncbi:MULTISPECIES: YrhK family protein [Chromohalobacter]|uniref:YrhK domain-containing protein n=1 Tax=Chromohalobacter israelensis (strain ATCC BAA-138 / DSM 3043 / CIP 106854 / NCIMB 13768 / 1H11) TaxID=290398 RepID=Q1QX77_CHRI1|nr:MULTISPECIES: YrhK family protein [Chromohalobacter]ABE58931.1 hypothetical protein Csal_1578 [Chromohalobacter salexigens DSM 3043]MBZ5876754.1 YrhK family protein [Chromohalobacter salexigens]MDF9434794.1 YrhK family protein [Chromohalobacter israelensis]MDO0945013.1 YrhK family protein [Chromohalobacter salexigens]NQY44462.1 YrhK family protein [Chromohalobacter sp.]
MQREEKPNSDETTFTLGREELIVHRRHELASTVNDLMLGLWFTIGSVCFFFQGGVKEAGIWLFVIGSLQLLIRPVIRLHRQLTLKQLPSSSQDF